MKKSFLFIIIVLLFASACKKSIVDVENPGAYNYYTYFNTPERINEAVAATYTVFIHPGMYSRDYYYMFDLLGNDAAAASEAPQDLSEFENYQFGKSNRNLGWLWASLYRMVLRANVVLDRAEALDPNSTDAELNQYKAEAKFLRGYAYFQLVTLWGRVPLRKSYQETVNDKRPPRTDTATIWKFIEADLKEARAVLVDDPELGRAGKGAAHALLGKMYLYRKNWSQAKAEFESFINATYSSDLSSIPYDDEDGLFGQNNQENEEIIFQVMHKAWEAGRYNYFEGDQESTEGGEHTHSARALDYGFADGKKVQVSTALRNAFTYSVNGGAAAPDNRGKFFMYRTFPSADADDKYCDHCGSGAINFNKAGTWWKKYEYYEYIKQYGERTEGSINSIIMRHADVLLMLAETYIEQNNLGPARDRINDVRARAGAPLINTLGTQSQARTILRRERQVELCGEQSRFFDLVRWGVLVSTLTAEGLSVEAKHNLLPIPQQERNTNPSVANDISGNGWN